MTKQIPSSIYGPVNSWRLGKSLGVDVLCIDSICSFECVYCQLGKINQVTTKRKIFVSTEKVLQDLEKSPWQTADVITFSGSGEPTLAENLGQILTEIKRITGKPLIVLTNSSLLNQADVRFEISTADKIFCKLDAWSKDVFRRIDRPHQDLDFSEIVRGISLLRQEYKGFLAIQTMILRLPNEVELKEFAEILSRIKPDEVQLNVPGRPFPQKYTVETRGNEVKPDETFTKLKTVSSLELQNLRNKLSQLVDFQIITR